MVPRFLNPESGPSPHILARSPHILARSTYVFAGLGVGLFVGAFTLLDDPFDPVQAWIVAVGAHYCLSPARYAFFAVAFSPRPILSISLK
jgi:uncharacterized membrane protein YdjX (TVP38/TMEM64 family)